MTSDHMGVLIHSWNRNRGKNWSFFQVGIKNLLFIYNQKSLPVLIKIYFLIAIIKDYFNWTLLCQLNNPLGPCALLQATVLALFYFF